MKSRTRSLLLYSHVLWYFAESECVRRTIFAPLSVNCGGLFKIGSSSRRTEELVLQHLGGGVNYSVPTSRRLLHPHKYTRFG